jgi:hypothetical protein
MSTYTWDVGIDVVSMTGGPVSSSLLSMVGGLYTPPHVLISADQQRVSTDQH